LGILKAQEEGSEKEKKPKCNSGYHYQCHPFPQETDNKRQNVHKTGAYLNLLFLPSMVIKQ
jgi:hypothetical protein